MTSPVLAQVKQAVQKTRQKQHKRSKTICKNNKCYRHVLKIKTKCCRYKCDKALKRKLYTYRLRPNGEEDPEVVNVSEIFLSSLKIKSPTTLKSPDKFAINESRPKNYLFKMARRKLKLKSESDSVGEKNKHTKTTNVSPLHNGKITSYIQSKSPMKNGRISQNAKEKETPQHIEKVRISKKSQETAVTDSQEKKQTNAFKLLMESRNKSIGSNSPGKEKNIDPSEMDEIIEKKTIKAKRKLALQKMAESKGALKYKEIEEQQEKCIQIKMENRAERLKKMIESSKPRKSKVERKKLEKSHKMDKEIEDKVKEIVTVIDVEVSNDNKISTTKQLQNNTTKKAKTLHLVNIFKEVQPKQNNISTKIKATLKEDEDFIKKLSPSIKKKENMLCYFNKIEKKCESPVDSENTGEQSPVMRVKLSSKRKKKMKKRKLSLIKNVTTEVLEDHNESSSNNNDVETFNVLINSKDPDVDEKIIKERKKRKRKDNFEEIDTLATVVSSDLIKAEEGRPKRNVKRPTKYVDDIQLSSSDEEYIFTPKKRRHVEIKDECVCKQPIDEIVVLDEETKMKTLKKRRHLKIKDEFICEQLADEIVVLDEETKKKTSKSKKFTEKDEKAQRKSAKLAPIFVPKPLINLEQLEAKQKFLYSGVPEKIKKMIIQQKNCSIEVRNVFPPAVHVQQIFKDTFETTKIPLPTEDSFLEEIQIDIDKNLFNKLLTPTYVETIVNTVPTQKNTTTAILQNIKDSYPKFPVHRMYRTLKSQSRGEFSEVNTPDLDNSRELMNGVTDIVNENPEYLNWTDKYKATSTKHLIGNFEGVKELKKWLTSWTDNEAKTKGTTYDSDSSDFCYDSDSNSRDCVKSMNNLLILTGSPGCGKTSSVYAVATELAIKVIEVNASSKRTGKVMLQDLQEATQSHKVNRAGLENSQKIQEVVEVTVLKTYKKKGRPNKSEVKLKKSKSKDEPTLQSQPSQAANSQESVRTGMSLILIDDADIVFDQDDGFSSAIAQLIQSSKRPVILVTGSLSCPHLQRFLQCGKIIYMNPLLPRMLGTWLDLMCLADRGTCWPGLGAQILDYFKGDIRKAINCLQFHTTAHLKDNLQDEATSQNSDCKSSPDDEGSNMSWPDSEGLDEKNTGRNSVKDDAWRYFMDKQIKLQHVAYPGNLLNVWWSIPSMLYNVGENKPQFEAIKPKANKPNPQENIQELDAVANLIDTFSISDLISNGNPDTTSNIASMPWYSSESDSVSELESLHGYNKSHGVANDILQNLVTSSVDQAQKALQCEGLTTIQFPSMTERRSRDRIIQRHEYISDMLNPSATLDRRALALDYWSTCRSICRIEKNKTDVVSKRNNRFCHYLKSMNSAARNEIFDRLGDSLSSPGET